MVKLIKFLRFVVFSFYQIVLYKCIIKNLKLNYMLYTLKETVVNPFYTFLHHQKK